MGTQKEIKSNWSSKFHDDRLEAKIGDKIQDGMHYPYFVREISVDSEYSPNTTLWNTDSDTNIRHAHQDKTNIHTGNITK